MTRTRPTRQTACLPGSVSSSTMIRIDEKTNQTPLCPHCEADIERLLATKVESLLGVRYVYFCEQCRKVLGVSHRKGVMMG